LLVAGQKPWVDIRKWVGFAGRQRTNSFSRLPVDPENDGAWDTEIILSEFLIIENEQTSLQFE
jgi:hypothetical protein